MIVDASAFVAILAGENDADSLLKRMESHGDRSTHAVSLYETVTALMRIGGRDRSTVARTVDRFLESSDIGLFPLGSAEASAALDAFERFGKGRHPAALNMGDCFSYACARLRGMPLLYKGDDFVLTDIVSA